MKPSTHPHLEPSLAMNGAPASQCGFAASKMKIPVEKQSLIKVEYK